MRVLVLICAKFHHTPVAQQCLEPEIQILTSILTEICPQSPKFSLEASVNLNVYQGRLGEVIMLLSVPISGCPLVGRWLCLQS